jgi:hypothetical protein
MAANSGAVDSQSSSVKRRSFDGEADVCGDIDDDCDRENSSMTSLRQHDLHQVQRVWSQSPAATPRVDCRL